MAGDAQVSSAQDWESEVLQARHDLLTQRDHIIGTEAEVARLTAANQTLRIELNRTRKIVKNVRGRLAEQRTTTKQLRGRLNRARAELEAERNRPSLSRRIARRLRGGSR